MLTLLAVLLLVTTLWSSPASPGRTGLAANWSALLDRSDVLILDTETTGLGNRAEVVEVALIDTRGHVRLERPIMPIGRISKQASQIHGLTRARLRELGAQPWPSVVPEYEALLRTTDTVLVWNAEFDARLISQTVQKHVEKGTAVIDALSPDFTQIRAHCLMTEYAALDGRERISLEEAAETEGARPSEPKHRAANDALTVLAVMRAVVATADQPIPQ